MSSRRAVRLRAAQDARSGIVDRDLAVAVYVPRVAWRYGLAPRGKDEIDIDDIDLAIPLISQDKVAFACPTPRKFTLKTSTWTVTKY